MLNFAGLGHSHIVALAKGAYALQTKGAPVFGRFIYLYDSQYDPPFTQNERGAELNKALEGALLQDAPRFLIASMGGNEHNIVSIVQIYQRYDFILGENPDLPVDETLEIIPEAAVRETLREWMSDKSAVLRAVQKKIDLPILHVEPPPPAPRAQVVAYPKEFFSSAVDVNNLSSDLLRYKMWRVQTNLCRELSKELGLIHVEVPIHMMDEEGMLPLRLCGQDATHANEVYGEAMIKHALDRLAEHRPDITAA